MRITLSGQLQFHSALCCTGCFCFCFCFSFNPTFLLCRLLTICLWCSLPTFLLWTEVCCLWHLLLCTFPSGKLGLCTCMSPSSDPCTCKHGEVIWCVLRMLPKTNPDKPHQGWLLVYLPSPPLHTSWGRLAKPHSGPFKVMWGHWVWWEKEPRAVCLIERKLWANRRSNINISHCVKAQDWTWNMLKMIGWLNVSAWVSQSEYFHVKSLVPPRCQQMAFCLHFLSLSEELELGEHDHFLKREGHRLVWFTHCGKKKKKRVFKLYWKTQKEVQRLHS